MSSALKVRLAVICTILMMAFIFYQSSLPADQSSAESDRLVPFVVRILKTEPDTASQIIRKTAHFLEYLLLGVLINLSVSGIMKKANFVIPWGIGTLYAISDEIHQSFVPGRSCEIRDMLIDACGTAAGVLLVLIIKKITQKKRSS